MTPKAEYRVHFNRRKRTTSKDGRFPVEIEGYIPFARERKYFSTSIRITPEQWYTGKKEDTYINRKHSNYQNLNNRIRAILKLFDDTEKQYLEKGIPFHLRYLNVHGRKEQLKSFTQYWEDFLKTNPKKLAPNTIKANRTALKYLRSFTDNINFSDLNKKLLLDYELYLLDYTYARQDEEFNLKPGFIHGLFKDFQATVNRAVREEIIQPQQSPFVGFSFSQYKNYESDIRYLTPQEVKAIEELDINKEHKHLIRARDMFLLACYTGLRFGDVTGLTNEHLVEKTDGIAIELQQEKTGKRVYIPISKMFDRRPLLIVKALQASGRKELFGNVTNQHINRQLKDLATLAGIDKYLTFHMARHTCATWLVSRKVPLITVRDVLGHSSIIMTEKYAKLIPKAMEDQLENVEY